MAEKRILLAMHDAALRDELAEKHLAPAGFECLPAESAAAVQDGLSRKRPSLVILCEDLPDVEIFSLARSIKSNQPVLPILMIASDISQQQLLEGLRIGIVDYLAMPVQGEELLQAVERALEYRRGWESWLKKETGRITGPLNKRLSEMESILRQVDDGVLVLDSKGRVMMLNQAIRSAFDLGDQEFMGLSLDEVVDNEDLVAALNDPRGRDGRIEIDARDGRTFSLRISTIPGVGTVASLHDISYLKELDRMKGDFVNTVSHDLRSPLTAILGYVELIERAGEVNEQQAQFIDRVKSSVKVTTDLIGDLLNLGRVEVGKTEEMQVLKMQEIVADAVESSMAQVNQRQQTLRLASQESLPPVLGSRTQMRQVVDNLIGNAVKYTQPDGEIRVMLRQEQDQVILHVADNGPGIPTEDQGRIFDKFYRASNASKEVQGTGLGLAIVKTVVENHSGRIWVDSKPGQGSVFTVVLPVAGEKIKLEPKEKNALG